MKAALRAAFPASTVLVCAPYPLPPVPAPHPAAATSYKPLRCPLLIVYGSQRMLVRMFRVGSFLVHLLTAMFLIGLVGSAVVVIISFVEDFRELFSGNEEAPTAPRPPRENQ